MTQQKILPWMFRLAVTVAVASLPSVVFAQTGTVMPIPVTQWFDANGDPLNGGKLCSFEAGTSTPLATYSDSSLSVANPNPVVLNAAGRPAVSGNVVGIYLLPRSYKFQLLTAGSDSTCNTGTTIWTLDNVAATPPSNVNLDIAGTAGETLTTGQVAILSDGSSSTTAGRWYRADADATYSSSGATAVGVVVSDATAGTSTSIRLQGRVTGLSGLTGGTTYFISATAGALTSTAPANAMRVGVAESATVLVLTPQGVSTNDRLVVTSPTVSAGTFTGAPTFSGAPVFSGLPLINGGLQFPATQAQNAGANVLDDFEEGSWTPVIAFGGSSSGVAYTTQYGRYVKVGKHVSIEFDLLLSNNGAGVGAGVISGLPFTSEASHGVGGFFYTGMATAMANVAGLLTASASTIDLYYAASAVSMAALLDTDTGNTLRISGTFSYRTAQ